MKRLAYGIVFFLILFSVFANFQIPIARAYTYSASWSVSASSDDCTADTTLSYMQPLTNNWIGFPRDAAATSDRQLGARWTGVNIPKGALILEANITGWSYGSYSGTVNTRIYGELTANSATFSTYANFIARTRTTESIDLDITASWTTGQEITIDEGLALLIQEVTNQTSWTSGNALTLFIQNDGTTGSTRRNFRSYDYTGNTFGLVLSVTWTYTEVDVTGKGGMSGYLDTQAQVSSAITQMGLYNCTILRWSFTPSWWGTQSHPYNASRIQYFLDNSPSNYIVIVDRNHLYPYGSSQDSDFIAHIETAKDDINAVCAAWPDSPRVYGEIVNEFTGAKSYVQDCLDHVRGAGYSNFLVWNRMYSGNWADWELTDTLNKWFRGMHFYFNSWSPSGAEAQMTSALAYGPVINTEMGADYNEGSSFTNATVQETNEFITWSQENGVANCVWQSGTPLGNTAEYNAHGFNWFLSVEEEEEEEGSNIVLIQSLGWNQLYEAPILDGYLTEHHPSASTLTSAHGTNIYASQSFYITNVTVSLSRSSTAPTCNIYLTVYDVYNRFDQLPLASAIATSNPINASTLASMTWGTLNFTFGTPFLLTGGNFYSLCIETAPSGGTIDDTHRVYIQFYNTTDSDYHVNQYNENHWFDDTPAYDCRVIMKVYGIEGTLDTYYWLTLQNGTYGTVEITIAPDPTNTYIEHLGSQMQLTGVPMNASYQFDYWIVSGSTAGPNPYLFTFNQNATIQPVFRAIGANTLTAQIESIIPIALGICVTGFVLVLTRRRNN